MPLNLFYTIVQKSQKWPKTQIKGGSCLNSAKKNERQWAPLTGRPICLEPCKKMRLSSMQARSAKMNFCTGTSSS